MNALVPIDTPAEPISWVIDFSECPPALDEKGRAGWAEVTALQCHVIVARLMAVNRRLRAERLPFCSTCGALPCRNPSFCDACRRADQNRKRSARR
jgi:hypothetical protein